MRTGLVLVLLAAFAFLTGGKPVFASSIFLEPPPSLTYDGQVIFQIQQPRAIRAKWGDEHPWGWWSLLPAIDDARDVACVVSVVAGMLPEMQSAAERNLEARCTGWLPLEELVRTP